MKHVRTIVTEARDAARPHGISVDLEAGGKHLCLVLRSPSGACRKYPVASSPKNSHDAIDNSRKHIRHIIWEMKEK